MSTLCLSAGWGEARTASVRMQHPFLEFVSRRNGPDQILLYLTQSSRRDIQHIAKLPPNWDGAESERPRPSSVANALSRLPELCKMATSAGIWRAPHVSASESGDVTFEWWVEERKLIVYFGDSGMEVLRVWGPDIHNQMEHFSTDRTAQLAPSWAWLNGN